MGSIEIKSFFADLWEASPTPITSTESASERPPTRCFQYSKTDDFTNER